MDKGGKEEVVLGMASTSSTGRRRIGGMARGVEGSIGSIGRGMEGGEERGAVSLRV